MFAPLHLDARPHAVRARVLQRVGRAGENASVEVGVDLLDVLAALRVHDPDHLVIARVVVFRKVDVVFPEEVIGDQAAVGMHDHGGVAQAEEFGRRRVEARRETAGERPLVGCQLTSGIERQRARVFAARFVQPAIFVIFDAEPGVQGRAIGPHRRVGLAGNTQRRRR